MATRKPAKRKPAKPRVVKTATTVLDAAETLEDASERAAFLEGALDKVDKRAKLVEPLLDALFDTPLDREAIGEHAVAMCRARAGDLAFLEAVGCELDSRYREDDAIEVLRMAVAAGTARKRTLEALGRLLVLRGDADGVPLLERAIARDPEWDEPRVALATWFHDKDPARALALLEDVDSEYAHELCAIIHRAAGRTADATRSQLEALRHFDNDIEGRKSLSKWHFDENRYAASRVHAKVLLDMRQNLPADEFAAHDLDDLDETISQAYRLGGGYIELIPWLRERASTLGISADLGWDVFHGLTSYSPTLALDLAIQAAEAAMQGEREHEQHDEVRLWRVRIARERAGAGETGVLEALAREGLDDDPAAWVELADAYQRVELYDAAHAAVDHALELDPGSVDAMSTLFDLALAAGDLDAMHRWSEALAAAKPRWHQGPELLGRTYARRGEAQTALVHARRALQIAPFCHNAWMGLGEAYVIAGDLERAREAAMRSIGLEAPNIGDDISILRAAVEGNAEALDAALAARYRHLPALPFPVFVEKLREAARRATPSS
jgi:tetratricopeptide (TPR) repeat protein